uniref:Si:dkey-16i5.8 n=1 Tax=Takifugu rubripes TaxID=31033 RepID=A0A674NLT1_TAKRU
HVCCHCYSGVGRCMCLFWFALAHDILGVMVIMVGVFGGLFFHDLFIYVGAIIIFLSLIWWVLWYTGNIDVPPKELEDDVGLMKLKEHRVKQLVRNMSERLSIPVLFTLWIFFHAYLIIYSTDTYNINMPLF